MNARRRDEAKVGTLARSATMQAPLLAQPDKRASLQRDRAIWADKCIERSLRWADFMVSHRPFGPNRAVAHARLDQCFPRVSLEEKRHSISSMRCARVTGLPRITASVLPAPT